MVGRLPAVVVPVPVGFEVPVLVVDELVEPFKDA